MQSWQAGSILHLNTFKKCFGSGLSKSKQWNTAGFILFVTMFCKCKCPNASLATLNRTNLCETTQLGEAKGITVQNRSQYSTDHRRSPKMVLFSWWFQPQVSSPLLKVRNQCGWIAVTSCYPVNLFLWCPPLAAVAFPYLPWLWYSADFVVNKISFQRLETAILIGMSKAWLEVAVCKHQKKQQSKG